MKKTAKGREANFKSRVSAVLPDRPMIWTADDRLGEPRLLDQPSATSKSAQNLAWAYEEHGGPYEMIVRAYILDGSNTIRLFGPVDANWPNEGYGSSIRLDSPKGLLLLRLFEEETGT